MQGGGTWHVKQNLQIKTLYSYLDLNIIGEPRSDVGKVLGVLEFTGFGTLNSSVSGQISPIGRPF